MSLPLYGGGGTTRSRLLRTLTVILVLLLTVPLAVVYAQDDETNVESAVYVTTQDYVSLRVGPGSNFDRISIVSPGVTLPALGRTVGNDWIQVQDADQRGWISAHYLIWSGDVMALTIDGVDPVPFARRARLSANGVGPYYTRRDISPQYQAGVLNGEEVELTGRMGYGEYIWLQFHLGGQTYWAPSWHFLINGNILDLPDASYVYPYGRLLDRIRSGLDGSAPAFSAIAGIWRGLANGSNQSCDDIPRHPRPVEIAQADLDREPLLAPAANALLSGISHTDNAITMFENVCKLQGADRFLTPETVNAALAEVDAAQRDFIFVSGLFVPLAENDPSLGGGR